MTSPNNSPVRPYKAFKLLKQNSRDRQARLQKLSEEAAISINNPIVKSGLDINPPAPPTPKPPPPPPKVSPSPASPHLGLGASKRGERARNNPLFRSSSALNTEETPSVFGLGPKSNEIGFGVFGVSKDTIETGFSVFGMGVTSAPQGVKKKEEPKVIQRVPKRRNTLKITYNTLQISNLPIQTLPSFLQMHKKIQNSGGVEYIREYINSCFSSRDETSSWLVVCRDIHKIDRSVLDQTFSFHDPKYDSDSDLHHKLRIPKLESERILGDAPVLEEPAPHSLGAALLREVTIRSYDYIFVYIHGRLLDHSQIS
jgi:hypothetical protein